MFNRHVFQVPSSKFQSYSTYFVLQKVVTDLRASKHWLLHQEELLSKGAFCNHSRRFVFPVLHKSMQKFPTTCKFSLEVLSASCVRKISLVMLWKDHGWKLQYRPTSKTDTGVVSVALRSPSWLSWCEFFFTPKEFEKRNPKDCKMLEKKMASPIITSIDQNIGPSKS